MIYQSPGFVSIYAESLGEFFDSVIKTTEPTFTHDIPNAVIGKINNILSDGGSHAVVFNTELSDEDKSFKSYFIILPSPTALDTLINKLLS